MRRFGTARIREPGNSWIRRGGGGVVSVTKKGHNVGIGCRVKCGVSDLARVWGKPAWFNPDAVAALRPRVAPLLSAQEAAWFEDTVRRFEALQPDPINMVFGHGDMHGYNMATVQDASGLRLVGAFDLGCTGILDIHEDLFRLSLVSEALLDRVSVVYQGLAGQTRALHRNRLAIYYRAFLFYLMDGKSGTGLQHLKRLFHAHIAYDRPDALLAQDVGI